MTRLSTGEPSAKTKVDEFDTRGLTNELISDDHILWLDVSMQDAFALQIAQRKG